MYTHSNSRSLSHSLSAVLAFYPSLSIYVHTIDEFNIDCHQFYDSQQPIKPPYVFYDNRHNRFSTRIYPPQKNNRNDDGQQWNLYDEKFQWPDSIGLNVFGCLCFVFVFSFVCADYNDDDGDNAYEHSINWMRFRSFFFAYFRFGIGHWYELVEYTQTTEPQK